MAGQIESDLVTEARQAILKRIISTAQSHDMAGSGGILEMAEAYTVLATNELSGRINAPRR